MSITPLAYRQPASAVVDVLESDAVRGLPDSEARHRLDADGPNVIESTPPISPWTLLVQQFRNPLVLLLASAIGVSLAAWALESGGGLPIDAIVIGLIVVVNAVLGAVQEYRADEAVRELSQMTEGHAMVRRDGVLSSVPFSEVVRGDLIALAEGDVVPADARVLVAESLLVAEAALTGESAPVSKDPAALDGERSLGDRTSMVYAGTAVVSGHGSCMVTATSMGTEVGHVASLLVDTEQPPTPLEREISRVSRFLGVVVVTIAVLISIVIASTSSIDSASDLVEVLLLGVSIAVAAVPEGLPAVLSIVLAVGVSRMADRNALVKRLSAAETLGSATVICTDKTGTLTANKMKVQTVVVARHRHVLSNVGDRGELDPQVRLTLVAAAAASNVEIAVAGASDAATGDPTEAALVTAAHAVVHDDSLRSIRRLAEVPFDADRKRMSVLVSGYSSDGQNTMIAKGAPDILLELCSAQMTSAGPVGLGPDDRNWWRNEIDMLAAAGMRTLLVASRELAAGVRLRIEEELDMVLLGLVGIFDPPRPGVAGAISTAQAAGIRVVMLTGDHPKTGSSIARDLGIHGAEGSVLVGSEIDDLSDGDLASAIEDNRVFARVAPAHKLRIVRALQSQGHVVAMTGDGVNDAPALKAADIGTAMGQSGTAVAREAADMVLTDDDFSTIVEAIRSGRTIFRNIANFLRYLLSSNVGEVLAIFLGVIFAGVIGLEADGAVLAPLTAVQILWINLLTDTAPAFALGLDGDDRVMERPPRKPRSRVIDAAMQRGILIIGLTMAVVTLLAFDSELPGGLIEGDGDADSARTMAFTVLVLAQLFNCFSARSDYRSAAHGWAANRLLLVAVAGSFLLQLAVVYVPFLQRGFDTTGLGIRDWFLAAGWASVVLVVSELRKWFERRIHARS